VDNELENCEYEESQHSPSDLELQQLEESTQTSFDVQASEGSFTSISSVIVIPSDLDDVKELLFA
jgi:hypothetical protein